MKNSVLAILAVIALASCEKKETTVVDNSADSSTLVAPADTEMMPADSTMVNQEGAALTDQDKKFADDAATGGMMEVMLGEYMAANGTHEKAKALGKMMATDHGKANSELKTWAAAGNYTLPTSLKAEQQKMVDDLKAKKGAELDKAYASMMVSDHKKDIAAFKKESTEGGNAALKAFASKTVPTLEHHLMSSEEAVKALK